MPEYEWNCLSCGHANEPAASACASCNCPPSATVKQIAAYREKYLGQGGCVLASAASVNDPDAEAIVENVVKVSLAGLAWFLGIGL